MCDLPVYRRNPTLTLGFTFFALLGTGRLRMFRSIRWTLQMWHAAILATVLVAFGSVMFYYLPLVEDRRINDDLQHIAFRVGASLRPVIPPVVPRPRFRESRHDRSSKSGGRPQFEEPERRAAGALETAERSSARRATGSEAFSLVAQHGQVGRPRRQEIPAEHRGREDTRSAAENRHAARAGRSASRGRWQPCRGHPAATASVTGTAGGRRCPGKSKSDEHNSDQCWPGKSGCRHSGCHQSAGRGPVRSADDRRIPRRGLWTRTPPRAANRADATISSPCSMKRCEIPYYFVVWHPDGTILLEVEFAPRDIDLPELPRIASAARCARQSSRQRGEFREAVARDANGGGPTSSSAVRSRATWPRCTKKSGMVAVVGLGVLAAGLVGGLWFSRRAIRPIEAISATAAEISLSNLSRRIDVTGTETELTGPGPHAQPDVRPDRIGLLQQVRFTADASHELRTPVAVILSHAELALDKQRPAEELRETIETCRRSALRMRLVDRVAVDAGPVRLGRGAARVAARSTWSRTVGDCVALVRPLAAQRRITSRPISRRHGDRRSRPDRSSRHQSLDECHPL